MCLLQNACSGQDKTLKTDIDNTLPIGDTVTDGEAITTVPSVTEDTTGTADTTRPADTTAKTTETSAETTNPAQTTPPDTTSVIPADTTAPIDGAVYAERVSGIDYLDEFFVASKLTTTHMQVYPSGWDVDTRGGELLMVTGSDFSIWDKSKQYPVTLEREINEIKKGTAVFETAFIIRDEEQGFYYCLKNAQNQPILKIATENGYIGYYDSSGKFRFLIPCEALTEYGLLVYLHMDSGEAEIWLNGKNGGRFSMTATPGLKYLTVGTTAESRTYVTLKYIRIHTNYLVYESFISAGPRLSERWKIQAKGNSQYVVANSNGGSYPDLYSLKLYGMGAGNEISAETSFIRIKGTAIFELYFYLPRKADGIGFALLKEEAKVLEVSTQGGYLVCGSQKLYEYLPDMWYILRIEADTLTGKAKIKLNGREIGVLAFGADFVDGIRISNNASESVALWVDDIIVYSKSPEPEDYVPAPVPAKSDGYYVGLQSCSLWRNGYNVGWDCITAFDEITPFLGYYDEGSPEVADWEIKWMVEHGIDYNLYCWYFPLNWNKSDAIQKPYNAMALHNGYFNAKYSHMMKYAIMWENYNVVVSSKVFREKVVPFWVEYYLKDSRYMTIDNKPLIGVYQWSYLVQSFGSAEGVRAELDYVRQVCRSLGYDGAIWMIQCSDLDEKSLQEVSKLGFDVMYRYSWGGTSYNIQNQIDKMETQKKLAAIDVMPTISMGYNNVAWNALRNDYVSLSDYRKLLNWAKNTFMKTYPENSLASRMVMFDNWNEYGEGHYLMPSVLAGFDYLDAIRDYFTAASGGHTDVVPTPAQKARINYLFPQNRVALRHLFIDREDHGGYILKVDGMAQTLDQTPVVNNDLLFVPFNPVRKLAERLNVVYRYDHPTGTLTLSSDYARIEFIIGSRIAKINDRTVDMGTKVYLKDGLPMIPLKLVCDAFGYVMQFDPGAKLINVRTNLYSQRTAEQTVLSNRKAFAWEFDVDGDFEQWTFGRAVFSLRAEGGALKGKVKGDLGQLFSPTFQMPASSNRYLHIRLKASGLYSNVLNVNFITTTDRTYTATKQVTVDLTDSDVLCDYVIDLGQCAAWSGTIAQIRLSLCVGGGEFEIDSIKLSNKKE